MGLRVLGPDVNESAVDYRGETQEDFGFRISDCGLKSVGGSEKGQHTKSPRQETGQDANPRSIANPKSEIRDPKSEIASLSVSWRCCALPMRYSLLRCSTWMTVSVMNQPLQQRAGLPQ
jgi:hypothetical protein